MVEGFGGKRKGASDEVNILDNIPSEAMASMQRSAVSAIASKADPRWLPVTHGKDKGLPKSAPVFDLDELRRRNQEKIKQKIAKGSIGG